MVQGNVVLPVRSRCGGLLAETSQKRPLAWDSGPSMKGRNHTPETGRTPGECVCNGRRMVDWLILDSRLVRTSLHLKSLNILNLSHREAAP